MKKNKNKIINLLIALTFILLLTTYIELLDLVDVFGFTYKRGIKGTGSMKPLLNKEVYPHTVTINRPLSTLEPLYIGRIYIYEKNDKLIVHRLIGFAEIEDKTFYIFKGDNNMIADELVKRKQVLEEVIGVDFE